MGSPDGLRAWIAGSDGLYVWSGGRDVSHSGISTPTSAQVRRIVRIETSSYALTGFSSGSTISRLDDDAAVPVYQSDDTINTVIELEDRFLVATMPGGELQLQEIATDGALLGTPRVISTAIEGAPSLRRAGDDLFLQLHTFPTIRLYRVEPDDSLTLLLEDNDPFHGPTLWGDRVLVGANRKLSELQGSVVTPLEGTERLVCLGSSESFGAWACVLPDLLAVAGDGYDPSPLFALADLYPPILDALDEGKATECSIEWLDFAADSGLELDREPPGPPSETEPTGCACSAVGPGGASPPAVLLLLLGLLALRLTRPGARSDRIEAPCASAPGSPGSS